MKLIGVKIIADYTVVRHYNLFKYGLFIFYLIISKNQKNTRFFLIGMLYFFGYYYDYKQKEKYKWDELIFNNTHEAIG